MKGFVDSRDKEEFCSLINGHKGIIYAVIKKFKNIIPERFEDDVYQDICLAVWVSFDKYEQKEYCAFSSWLWKTAEWAVLKFNVKQKQWKELLQAEYIITNHHVDEQYDEDEIVGLKRAISSFPDFERKIFELQLEGDEYPEIASKLRVTKSVVNHRLSRAYEKIRKNADAFFDIPPKVNKGGHLTRRGLLNPLSRTVLQIDDTGIVLKEWASVGEANRNGFDGRRISEVARGVKEKYRGFYWRYSEELKTA